MLYIAKADQSLRMSKLLGERDTCSLRYIRPYVCYFSNIISAMSCTSIVA